MLLILKAQCLFDMVETYKWIGFYHLTGFHHLETLHIVKPTCYLFHRFPPGRITLCRQNKKTYMNSMDIVIGCCHDDNIIIDTFVNIVWEQFVTAIMVTSFSNLLLSYWSHTRGYRNQDRTPNPQPWRRLRSAVTGGHVTSRTVKDRWKKWPWWSRKLRAALTQCWHRYL